MRILILFLAVVFGLGFYSGRMYAEWEAARAARAAFEHYCPPNPDECG